MITETETLIIGGGLSGLRVAQLLAGKARAFHVLEARDRLGGRILTERIGNGYFDMGPAWFWPGQPRMAALVGALGVEVFEQYADGALMFEDADGGVQRDVGFSSMQGALRLVGGLGGMIDALVSRLPVGSITRGETVTGIALDDDGITVRTAPGDVIRAERVIIALPPRLAAEGITFTPALPDRAMADMAEVATWMAGQAKVIAVYDTPFWRDAGLSGDAMSRRGPMVEIHDASPYEGGPFALFGFVGVPAHVRDGQGDAIKAAAVAQLGRLFGQAALVPHAVHLADWAYDSATATTADQQLLYAHPQYGMLRSLAGLYDGRLHFGGTEVAPQFGGFLEGALEAAENVVNMIDNSA